MYQPQISKALLFLLVLSTSSLVAQDEGKNDKFKRHRVALFLGNAHVPAGNPDTGRNGAIIAATWGLDYEYWFHPKWAFGIYNDIELRTYVVNNGNIIDLEREYPFITSLVLVYVPWKTFSIYAGPALEIERNQNFYVTKIGMEYAFELPNNWDLAPGLSYDSKEGEYGTWSFGFSLGKKF